MEITDIVSLISTVGFPIVCVIFMWRYINSAMKEYTTAVNNNTRAVERLIDRLGVQYDIHGGGDNV